MPIRVLVRERGEGGAKRFVAPWDPDKLLMAVGWIGAVLTGAALADYAIALFPPHFSSVEWEFGTISQVFAGLPLVFIGMVAIWLSGAGLGRRWVLLASGLAMEFAALCVVLLLLGFALDIPIALRSGQGAAHSAVVKVIVKTLAMGLLFGTSLIVSGVLALRQARTTVSGGAAS